LNEGQLLLNDSQQRRPPFAQSFPKDVRIDELVDAFGRGDNAFVRAAGEKLAREAEDESVRAAARTLVDRTKADPLTKTLLALAGALLVLLSTWWVVHGRPPPPRAAPPAVSH
jgi:hypothetical protein